MFWPGDQGQAGQFLHGYQSIWLPAALLRRRARRARRRAVRRQPALGVLAAPQQGPRRRAGRSGRRGADTATNPAVLDAFALAIIGAEEQPAYPGVAGHEPDAADGAQPDARRSGGRRASCARSRPTPASYVSESNYFERGLAGRVLGSELRAAAGGEGQVRPGGPVLRPPRGGQRTHGARTGSRDVPCAERRARRAPSRARPGDRVFAKTLRYAGCPPFHR